MSVEVSPYVGIKSDALDALKGSGRTEQSANPVGVAINATPYSSAVSQWSNDVSATETTQTFLKSYSFRIRPAQRQALVGLRLQQSMAKTVRRWDGFLIEDQGEEYKVAFVENGDLVFYYLPSSRLRKAGITAPNQPFQMDELELELPDGRNATAYSFVPLAKPSDSFPDPIEMNEERQRKLKAIFSRFGKPKG